MAAGTYDFTVEQGTTMEVPLVWKDSNNAVINLSGYTARMQARQTLASTTMLNEWTTENGGILIDGPTGTITLTATAVQTAAWAWPITAGQSAPTAVYDLEVVSPAGKVTRLLKGKITLDQEVTR